MNKEFISMQLSVTGELIEMPLYRSHKIIAALEIADFKANSVIEFKDDRFAPAGISLEMLARYRPVKGDFYVVYEDGYRSFSPRKAFLDGYSKL